MAKDEKRKPKKCKIDVSPETCDLCGRLMSRVNHVPSDCVPDHLPRPKPGEHVNDAPDRWICERCVFEKNMDRLT
jgi:hypothetical protein